MAEVFFPLILAVYVSYNYGAQFTYEVLHYSDPRFGSAVLFFVTFIGGIFFWRGPVRNMLNDLLTKAKSPLLNWRRRRTEKTLGKPEELQRVIERGVELIYEGHVNRALRYSGQHRIETARVNHLFQLRRNTLAMTPREREAAEIMLVLDYYGLLGQARDALRYAIIYGDGKAKVAGKDFTADARFMREYNLRSLKALAALDAEARGISMEGAISDLFSLLQAAAAGDKSPKPLQDLLRRLRPGDDPGHFHAVVVL